jgi:diguanylate cyclase (GGDEF)-like protein
VDGARECARVAGTIIAVLDEPVELDGRTVTVGASVGIALFPEDGSGAAELIRRADAAMYAAKALGGNRAKFAGELGAADPSVAGANAPCLDDERR